MSDFKKRMLVAAIIAGLAVIGYLMNSQQAVAEGPPTGLAVNIVNPVPLPVTGSTTVSGAVAATQSGAWSVGITGTPNVHVANPATAPVLFVNVNDPGRIPYQALASANCSGGISCEADFATVPANHRLVIQHLTGYLEYTGPPSQPLLVQLFEPGGKSQFMVTASAPLGPLNQSAFDQSVLLYVDAGTAPKVVLTGSGLFAAQFTATGYMLDCTVAPCAAIAN
jgi:hypothetical protein